MLFAKYKAQSLATNQRLQNFKKKYSNIKKKFKKQTRKLSLYDKNGNLLLNPEAFNEEIAEQIVESSINTLKQYLDLNMQISLEREQLQQSMNEMERAKNNEAILIYKKEKLEMK